MGPGNEWGAGNKLGARRAEQFPPPWKLYFNPWFQVQMQEDGGGNKRLELDGDKRPVADDTLGVVGIS